ncbi:NUDIX hydrolase [Ruania alkalisoli]|uniref:NUDIX hydrolase n=1 Tax=Ruania alkalisoli TaxID=2779775 RepID=A0A7M1SXA7_9MICO|nr:NUDIX hydrolase [Ruania alkalisoli]QOR72226.1 NUDIX hydrolase [Ruania alkalisoli]
MPDDRRPARQVHDERVDLPTSSTEELHTGYVMDLVAESVSLGAGGTVRREFVRHPGAVAVVALDDAERVALLRQYRHPVRAHLWEVPAGLLDVPGEPLQHAAARELTEEADLRAATWHTLVDFFTTPGGSDERIRIFLARDLSVVPEADRYQREAEEIGMELAWVPLADAVAAALAGRIHNPSTVTGVLAAQAARDGGWSALRPADTPWQPAWHRD